MCWCRVSLWCPTARVQISCLLAKKKKWHNDGYTCQSSFPFPPGNSTQLCFMASLTRRYGPITEFWPVVSGQKWSYRCLTHKNLPLQSCSLSHQLADWWGFKESGGGRAVSSKGSGTAEWPWGEQFNQECCHWVCYKQEMRFYGVKLLRNGGLSITTASVTLSSTLASIMGKLPGLSVPYFPHL